MRSPPARGASTSTTTLRSFDTYLDKDFEFDTATRAGARVALKFEKDINGHLAPYIIISDSFLSLLTEPEYLDGRTRNVALLTLGCSF